MCKYILIHTHSTLNVFAGIAGGYFANCSHFSLSLCKILTSIAQKTSIKKYILAGDCRVVLGSQKADGSWLATPLSTDQNARNEEEVQRIFSEHPGEEMVIRNERLLGQLQPLRAFGDIQYKWDRVTHNHILTQVYGGPIVPPNLYKTPPYLTAKPVVTKRQIEGCDKFMILASDGLWDSLTNQQAVELVGQFLDSRRKTTGEVIEKNAASHLIRSAIGGNDHHFVAQMLLVPEQYRRMWRDDITVTVVFFKSTDLHANL